MASSARKEAEKVNDSLEDHFSEAARLYDDSPVEHSLPEASKTSNTPVKGMDLAAAVDGGNGDLGHNSTLSQGLHLSLNIVAANNSTIKMYGVYT